MVNAHTNALGRGRYSLAKMWRDSANTALQLLLKFVRFWRDPRQSLPRLTDRQARDVGLDPADLEWTRLQLPSRTTRHPML